MKTVPVDYNATTPGGSFRLNFPDTQEALNEIKARPGDYIWLSDGEVLLGAKVVEEQEYGLVASPRWKTLVHLDEYADSDLPRLKEEYRHASNQPHRSIEEEKRVFELLMVWSDKLNKSEPAKETIAEIALASTITLSNLNEYGMALTTLGQLEPNLQADPYFTFLHLKLLWQVDLELALEDARHHATNPVVDALVLAACIDIGTAYADRLPDVEFRRNILPVIDWIERFEAALGGSKVPSIPQAQVYFNRGLIEFRFGNWKKAIEAFKIAHDLDPTDRGIAEAYQEAKKWEQTNSFKNSVPDKSLKLHQQPIVSLKFRDDGQSLSDLAI